MENDPESESMPPYPREILPIKDAFELRISQNYLVDSHAGLLLQRCVEHPLGEVITPADLGENLNGFSVNLLGGNFKPEHVKWRPTVLNDLWDGKEVPVAELESNYRYDVRFCGVYIKASEVNGQKFTHPRHYTDETKFKEDVSAFVNKFASYRKGEPVEMNFVISIVHKPTFANYWHTQIEVSKNTDPTSDSILEIKAKWEKKMLRTFRTVLLPYCCKTYPEVIPTVNKSEYIRAN